MKKKNLNLKNMDFIRTMKLLKKTGSLSLIVVLCLQCSCKKFLEVDGPKNVLVSGTVFQSDKSATSAQVGIYSSMMQVEQIFSGNATIDCGLYADELTNTAPTNEFVSSQLTSDYTEVNSAWTQIYNYIYGANAVLEGVAASAAITPTIRNQLTGEAKFTRAFCYFYLNQLYGDVPLVTSTNYVASQKQARTPSSLIYQQEVADLKDAQQLLVGDYSFSNGERVRPNKWAATALLARIYLYNKDWQNAADQANAVINSGAYSLTGPETAFLKNNSEAIWQLMPVNSAYNTYEAQSFVPPNATSTVSYPMTNSLLQAFEPGDKRLSNWTGSSVFNGQQYYFPNKYKVLPGGASQEYYTVLRLAEQYLIHAEALAQLNKSSEAVSDLNVIRTRAGLPSLSTSLSHAQTLQAVAQERRVEFFAEWGQRYFDLVRTGQANDVIGALKPSTWKLTSVLWPIPIVQINANLGLTQNPGY